MNKKKVILSILITITIIMISLGAFLLFKEEKPISVTVTATNDFNSRIIREINKNENKNYLISPYSIEIALNMLRDGANNQTKKQIDNLIGERQINSVILKNRINIANSAFIKNKYKENVTKDYYQTLKNKYNADILFDEYKTPKVINDWVNKETDGMIKEIIDSLDKNFVMGIANAVAIDVEWKQSFECTNTIEEEFTKINYDKYKVSMMHNTYKKYSNTKYFETNKEKGIVIPYKTYDEVGEETYDKGNSLEFIGILPNESIKDYISNINEETYKRIDNNIKLLNENEEIHLSLPMFKYEYEVKDFKNNLRSLGITDVFDPISADLSNMIKAQNINFYVSDAIHKTYIDLNEKGTKAAAVTAFMIKANSAMAENKNKIIKIEFNKPFAYIIRDSKTKELLFFGVVYEPNKWKGSTCK